MGIKLLPIIMSRYEWGDIVSLKCPKHRQFCYMEHFPDSACKSFKGINVNDDSGKLDIFCSYETKEA